MPYKDPEIRRQKAREYNKAWRLRHPGRQSELDASWRERNWDKHLARAKRYRDRRRDRVRESMARTDSKRAQTELRKKYKAEYKKKNVDRQRVWERTARINRALRKAKNGGSATLEQWIGRCEMYGWKCAYCLKPLDENTVEIEHVIPVARGGTGWPSNLVPACRSCNAKKHANKLLPLRLRKES